MATLDVLLFQLCVEPGAALAEVSDLGTVLTPEASASLLKDKFLITGVTYKPEAEDAPDSSGEDPLGHNKLTELMKVKPPLKASPFKKKNRSKNATFL